MGSVGPSLMHPMVRDVTETRQREKELKRLDRYPGLAGRMMPVPSVDPALDAHSMAQQVGPARSYTMLPTLEEFGVRKPLEKPASEKPGEGTSWPMMSRTMQHVRGVGLGEGN